MKEGQQVTLIENETGTPPSGMDDNYIAMRIDCFFEGGDTVPLWIEGPRLPNITDRLARLTRLFEHSVMVYRLPSGGIGLLNPARMTRVRFDAGTDQLPTGSWRLNPAS